MSNKENSNVTSKRSRRGTVVSAKQGTQKSSSSANPLGYSASTNDATPQASPHGYPNKSDLVPRPSSQARPRKKKLPASSEPITKTAAESDGWEQFVSDARNEHKKTTRNRKLDKQEDSVAEEYAPMTPSAHRDLWNAPESSERGLTLRVGEVKYYNSDRHTDDYEDPDEIITAREDEPTLGSSQPKYYWRTQKDRDEDEDRRCQNMESWNPNDGAEYVHDDDEDDDGEFY